MQKSEFLDRSWEDSSKGGRRLAGEHSAAQEVETKTRAKRERILTDGCLNRHLFTLLGLMQGCYIIGLLL